ncbi:hypothetical protein [Staphylococcus pseudintermedius]|uniref:hypothetical protein n=1 Tax=Staphylococcus pseudintermedius TaxID=283734 RepID=UPI00374FD35F
MPEVQYNVICENVTKIYDLNRSRKDKLLSLFTFGKSYQFKPYYALKDVSSHNTSLDYPRHLKVDSLFD